MKKTAKILKKEQIRNNVKKGSRLIIDNSKRIKINEIKNNGENEDNIGDDQKMRNAEEMQLDERIENEENLQKVIRELEKVIEQKEKIKIDKINKEQKEDDMNDRSTSDKASQHTMIKENKTMPTLANDSDAEDYDDTAIKKRKIQSLVPGQNQISNIKSRPAKKRSRRDHDKPNYV